MQVPACYRIVSGDPKPLNGTVVSGTGHRPQRLGSHPWTTTHQRRLAALARVALTRYGGDIGVSGLARGRDTALAQAFVDRGLPWIAAVPFCGQDATWSGAERHDYRQLLNQATVVGKAFEELKDKHECEAGRVLGRLSGCGEERGELAIGIEHAKLCVHL